MSTKIKYIVAGLVIAIFLSAWFLLSPHENERITAFQIRYGFLKIHQSFEVAVLPFDEQVDKSDVVFTGKVLNISPTMWNQDSGEYWDGGFMYHTIQFEVSQYIVDRIGMPVGTPDQAATIEIIVLGTSPLEDGAGYSESINDNEMALVKHAEYSMYIGDTVVVFARSTSIAWREEGTKPFIEIISVPIYSIFTQSDDNNFKGMVVHNLGKGNFTAFATEKGQEIYRLEMTKKDRGNSGLGNFITDDISISLDDFITQIQAADQNQPLPPPQVP